MADHSAYERAAAAFPTPTFIEATEMRALLLANRGADGDGGGKEETKRRRVQVVDVRGSDFAGGKLPGAINVPTDAFKEDEKVDGLVAQLKDTADVVVFHCGKSQQRGPFSAARFLSRLNAATAAAGGSCGKGPEVMVLKDGWEGWVRQFGAEEGMVEPIVGK